MELRAHSFEVSCAVVVTMTGDAGGGGGGGDRTTAYSSGSVIEFD